MWRWDTWAVHSPGWSSCIGWWRRTSHNRPPFRMTGTCSPARSHNKHGALLAFCAQRFAGSVQWQLKQATDHVRAGSAAGVHGALVRAPRPVPGVGAGQRRLSVERRHARVEAAAPPTTGARGARCATGVGSGGQWGQSLETLIRYRVREVKHPPPNTPHVQRTPIASRCMGPRDTARRTMPTDWGRGS